MKNSKRKNKEILIILTKFFVCIRYFVPDEDSLCRNVELCSVLVPSSFGDFFSLALIIEGSFRTVGEVLE